MGERAELAAFVVWKVLELIMPSLQRRISGVSAWKRQPVQGWCRDTLRQERQAMQVCAASRSEEVARGA